MPRVVFIGPDGGRREIEAEAGQNLMEIARANGIAEIEGACGGAMACSTCHVVVDPAFYDRLAPPSEEEEELLDLAFALTPTSRLGCQIVLSDALDGLVVTLPGGARNLLVG